MNRRRIVVGILSVLAAVIAAPLLLILYLLLVDRVIFPWAMGLFFSGILPG